MGTGINLKEDKQIQTYLKNKDIFANKTPEGLYYLIENQGFGITCPTISSTVKIKVTISLLNEKVVDTNFIPNIPLTALLNQINEHLPPPTGCETFEQPQSVRHNQPKIDKLHKLLVTFTGGKDVAAISGFSDKMFLKLTAEVGNNVNAWATADLFTSW